MLYPMAAQPGGEAVAGYVLATEVVRDAIVDLSSRSIHETFPAYLHLRRRMRLLNRPTDLQPDWGEVSDWLAVPGGPPNKPHFRPFRSRGASPEGRWMNDNLAGSFAPSSLRNMKEHFVAVNGEYRIPLRQSDRRPNGALIRVALLADKRIPIWAVAVFILRNAYFPGDEPDWTDLIDTFVADIGWTQHEVEDLFTLEAPAATPFERVFDLNG